jgi:hypothetical protein
MKPKKTIKRDDSIQHNQRAILDNYMYLGQIEFELQTLQVRVNALESEKVKALDNINSLLNNGNNNEK